MLSYLVFTATIGGIYALLALGLNIQWGFTGLFNAGIAGFFAEMGWGNVAMILVAFFLLYLAIRHKFEPLLLLPIGFGGLLSNIPEAGLGLSVQLPTKKPALRKRRAGVGLVSVLPGRS